VIFDIQNTHTSLTEKLQHTIDTKTKPHGSLGKLEDLALQIGCIQNTTSPVISKPAIVVFAGDHGVVKNHPVSPYPQEVTAQMVLNFLQGGAAINVFSKLNAIDLTVVDCGVCFDFDPKANCIHVKITKGTEDYTKTSAMSLAQCSLAIEKGAQIIKDIYANGCNTIGFGEMGIGNTSSAALLMHAFTNVPIEKCTGKGTGLQDDGVLTKIEILKKAIQLHGYKTAPLELLASYGGFEIAMMVGAILQAAEQKMVLVIDGFIATSALLTAFKINDKVLAYCIFSHTSGEKGHKKMLDYLQVSPLLNLGLRLGEGTGAALAMPTLQAAVAFLNEMASFESAKVSESVHD